MPLRLLEIVIPSEKSAIVKDELLANIEVSRRFEQVLENGLTLVKLVVDSQDTQDVLDRLESQFSSSDSFRVVILPIEGTIPRIKADPADAVETAKKRRSKLVAREELYNDISHEADASWVFVAQVVLSTVVAAVGLVRNDVAVIIGAMVIAPLLGPNVSLALSTTLGDLKLAVNSFKTNILGVSIALALSIVAGFLLAVDPNAAAIASRTRVDLGDVILALASGSAGVLAFTSGVPSALVGVMVAVALLPPLVVFGLMTAAGDVQNASGALLLVTTNVICVNLAGVFTFYVQGVQPRTWWEARRAKTATRISLLIWTILLIVLGLLITLASS